MPETVKGLTPKSGVIQTRPGERVLGRYLSARVSTDPEGDDTIRDLLADAFWARYKAEPSLKEQVPPERSVNKTLLEWAMSQDGWQQSCSQTIGNILPAVTSASLLYEMLSTDSALKEALERQRAAEEAARLAREAREQASQEFMYGDPDAADRLNKEADEYEKDAGDFANDADDMLDKLKKNPLAQGMMSGMVKKASDKAEETAKTMTGWGLGGDGIGFGEIDDVLRVLSDYSDKLAQIGKLVGHLKGVSKSEIEQARLQFTGAVTELALTKDPLKLIPSELSYLLEQDNDNPLALEKTAQFLETVLLGWKPTVEGQIEGAFVAMVDVSGSMWGQAEIMAKAVALAIGKALLDDNKNSLVRRRYILGLFASNHQCPTVTSDNNWKEHMDWARINDLGGGTDFDYALRESTKLLTKLREDKVQGADLLFISDGGAGISDQTKAMWEKYKSETGSRIVYVQIMHGWMPDIANLSDMTVQVDDLSDATIERLTRQITSFIMDHESHGWSGD